MCFVLQYLWIIKERYVMILWHRCKPVPFNVIGRKGEDKMSKRVILIVMDSFGIGQMPDAKEYGDVDVNTLASCMTSPYFKADHLGKLGLFSIDSVKNADFHDEVVGTYARMKEQSRGKDTTIGHWEIAGLVSMKPLPTFPDGFPKELLDEFSKRTNRGILCNLPYSGTKVIEDYGDEHVKSGDLIIYTSADSVFQIAAHEEVVPVEQLYEYCKIARELLVGDYGVGRVIARPFIGKDGCYTRTANRHDFSLLPPKDTMLDILKNAGLDTIAVGKIKDIFAGKGISEFVYTKNNEDGIEKTLHYLEQDFHGLLFVNLVDYDMLYGHRRDIDGYAKAVAAFDDRLGEIIEKLTEDDLLMITADHGCDPAYQKTTDHTREYTPLLMYQKGMKSKNLGTRDSFSDIAATVLDFFKVQGTISGKSMLNNI